MVVRYYLLIFCIVVNIFSTTNFCRGASKYNSCVNVSLNKGFFSDVVEFAFRKKPYYFFDYVSEQKFKKIINFNVLQCSRNISQYKKSLFFVPYVLFSQKCSYIDKLNSRGYALITNSVDKPVKGIYIAIIYDSSKVKFEHKYAQVLDPHSILFEFYDLNTLESINQRALPLRLKA